MERVRQRGLDRVGLFRMGMGAALCALVAVVAIAVAAPAGAEMKSKKAEGRFLGFDSEANTIEVKVKGKSTTFAVKPDGSVLTRTTVTINGRKAEFKDLPEKAPVIVYWRPDDADKKKKFARKVDAPRIPDDLLEEWENN